MHACRCCIAHVRAITYDILSLLLELRGFEFRGSLKNNACAQMLHQSRVKAVPARQRRAASFLERLRRENSFYATPFGSNDDWYWLYAAVKSGDHLCPPCVSPCGKMISYRWLNSSNSHWIEYTLVYI